MNDLKRQSNEFDVKTAEPRAMLNYVDPYFMGIQNQGTDTLHSVNWRKSLHNAKVTLEGPIHGVPTTLSTLSSTDQLMIDSKEFSSSNWLIYRGLPKVRTTLRTLHEMEKDHK